MSTEKNCQIYIARLPPKTTEKDLTYKFEKFGEIKNIDLKHGFAFIEYSDNKEAENAIEKMNGKTLNGQKIVVEPSSKHLIFI